jgi:hypothetical protein
MDDYRDLVTVSFAAACAGIMLVAGELYIEQRATDPPGHQVETPQPQSSPALISRAPAYENSTEPRQAVEKKRTG